jgi:hypothetical protein
MVSYADCEDDSMTSIEKKGSALTTRTTLASKAVNERNRGGALN